MSETGTSLKGMIGELRGEHPSVFAMFMHDLSHELTTDELEAMLNHARSVSNKESNTDKKTKFSDAEGDNAKLKELADEVRGIAQSIEDGEYDLPKDMNEVTVKITIEGTGE